MNFRRFLCRHFNLVFREDHEALYSRWIQYSERTRMDIKNLEKDLADLNALLTKVRADAHEERVHTRILALQACLVETTPITAMAVALSKLRGSAAAAVSSSVTAAIKVLEEGMITLRKKPVQQGTTNGANSHAAA